MKQRINENTKITLTVGQLRRLIMESDEDSNVFGIPGLNVHSRDSYWRTPDYFEYHGKHISVTDLAYDVSHVTFVSPMNGDKELSAWSMLNKANSADPKLFKEVLLNVLNKKRETSWWDDTVGKWEDNVGVLRKKNRDEERRQRDLDMMNGL